MIRKALCYCIASITLAATPGVLAQFGEIDIYLFDQLLRGRLPRGSRLMHQLDEPSASFAATALAGCAFLACQASADAAAQTCLRLLRDESFAKLPENLAGTPFRGYLRGRFQLLVLVRPGPFQLPR